MKTKICTLLLFCCLCTNAFSQKLLSHNELGIFLGVSSYMGDLNPYSPFTKYVKPAVGLVYRRVLNPRFALKTNFYYGKVAGDDASSIYPLQRARGLNFVTPIYELSQQIEFNFFPYEIGNPRLYYTTPYIFTGLSGFYYTPTSNGTQLSSSKAEGNKYSPIAIALPIGIGFKADVSRRFGFSLEWGMRRAWTDYIDDVSKTYSNTTIGNPSGAAIGRQRGNSKSKDWYSFAGIILTYRVNDKLALCPAYQ